MRVQDGFRFMAACEHTIAKHSLQRSDSANSDWLCPIRAGSVQSDLLVGGTSVLLINPTNRRLVRLHHEYHTLDSEEV